MVFSPLPRLRGLLQRCWGRLERGLLPGFSGGQSPPWGRCWPLPLPPEGEGGIGAVGPVFAVEGRREGAGAGEPAALAVVRERGGVRRWPLLPLRLGGVSSICVVFLRPHAKTGLKYNGLPFFPPLPHFRTSTGCPSSSFSSRASKGRYRK